MKPIKLGKIVDCVCDDIYGLVKFDCGAVLQLGFSRPAFSDALILKDGTVFRIHDDEEEQSMALMDDMPYNKSPDGWDYFGGGEWRCREMGAEMQKFPLVPVPKKLTLIYEIFRKPQTKGLTAKERRILAGRPGELNTNNPDWKAAR